MAKKIDKTHDPATMKDDISCRRMYCAINRFVLYVRFVRSSSRKTNGRHEMSGASANKNRSCRTDKTYRKTRNTRHDAKSPEDANQKTRHNARSREACTAYPAYGPRDGFCGGVRELRQQSRTTASTARRRPGELGSKIWRLE